MNEESELKHSFSLSSLILSIEVKLAIPFPLRLLKEFILHSHNFAVVNGIQVELLTLVSRVPQLISLVLTLHLCKVNEHLFLLCNGTKV